MMKKFLKAVLPSPVYDFLKATKNFFRWHFNYLCLKTRIMLHLPIRKYRNKIQFEINLAEHCNLNCYGCSNFSCIAEPELLSVDEFRKQITRMGEIFNHSCERIYLIGGEPLLNPDVSVMVGIAREAFTEGNIYVYTNGILLSQQEGSFWQTLHDNNVGIKISGYPITLDRNGIDEAAKNFGVSVEYVNDQISRDEGWLSLGLDLTGTTSIKLAFGMCSIANKCITLDHGHLFPCTFTAHVRHFNKRFGPKVDITEADYVNIYDNVTADEILDRLAEPIPACRYCKGRIKHKRFSWTTSKKDINEWL